MAENQQDRAKEDLTEEASPYRLEENRRKGIVSQSREVSSLMAFLAAGVSLYAYAPSFGRQFTQFMEEIYSTSFSLSDINTMSTINQALFKAMKLGVALALPVCAAGFVLSALASFGQIGPIFSYDPIQPDLEKINPQNGIKRLLSMRQFYEGLRVIAKMVILLTISYLLVRTEILSSPKHLGGEADYLLTIFGNSTRSICSSLLVVLALFASGDYFLQKYEFLKNLRMTKQEAKQEHKEREGDPQIRARIRAVQREMARKRMMAAVKKADVIITNPTHIAVAISYDRLKMSAPKVVAKGADLVAQKIKEIAKEAGVPLVENVPLARTLFKTVKLGQSVPRALYQAVAEVLAYVYRLKRRDL